jgi:hypothetical protein
LNEQVMANTAEVPPFETNQAPVSFTCVATALAPSTEVVGGDRLRSPAGERAKWQYHGVSQRGIAWHSVAHLGVADHYTLRLAPGTKERLNERAHRAHLPERTLAQRYVEEGLRHDMHPLIHFLDGPSGRRASLIGRGLDVWEVIATVRDNDGSIPLAAQYLQVPAGLVEAAAAYYGEYRDEIDIEIESNESEYERGRAAASAGEQALRM